MKKSVSVIVLLLLLILLALNTFAIQRFPKPEFETKYTQPATQIPAPRSIALEYLDVVLLVGSLSLISWFILKKRSRKAVFAVTVFSIIYFGFYRKGCICAIGSIQNVVLALFIPEYHVPLTAVAFFVIPLIFTLFYGRTFCAGVCPLGAIQDVFAIKPMNLNSWVQSLLGLLPFLYLGLAILYAATGTDFIICRYDPFVGFFRINATFMMFAIGAILLLIGVFIARPYCRFLCPYGVLLNLVSRVSKKHVSITPSTCIDCRLCENSCPFGAINKPGQLKAKENRQITVRRLLLFTVFIPVFVLLGGYAGSKLHSSLASVNPRVRLAKEIILPDDQLTALQKVDVTTFRSSGKAIEKLNAEVEGIVRQFYWGGWILGGFIGLVFGLTLAGLSVPKYNKGYWPNKGTCLSCSRCLEYCPVKEEMNDAQLNALRKMALQ
jgi:NosR/NirI family transcriptional regulator, nitrous oxide reductase regulator